MQLLQAKLLMHFLGQMLIFQETKNHKHYKLHQGMKADGPGKKWNLRGSEQNSEVMNNK